MGRGTAATDQPSQDGRRRALPASLFPEKSRPSPAPGRPSARLQGGSAATPAPRPIPAQRSLPSASPIGCQLPGRGCQRRVGRGRGSVGKGVERSRENVRMGRGGSALRDAHWLELCGRRCPLDASLPVRRKGGIYRERARKEAAPPLDALGLSPPPLGGGRPRPFSGEPYCGMFTSAPRLLPLQIRAAPGHRGSRASAGRPPAPCNHAGKGGGGPQLASKACNVRRARLQSNK